MTISSGTIKSQHDLIVRGSEGDDCRVQTRKFHQRSLYSWRQETHRRMWKSLQEGQKDV